MSIEEIKHDQYLRPLFLEFICRNLILGMTDIYQVGQMERIKIQKEFYDSMLVLSQKLEGYVPQDRILPTIEEVSKFYLSGIGRIGFERYTGGLN
jgi:hypothetical protein